MLDPLGLTAAPQGATAPFTGVGTALNADLERDLDGDGNGDDTQDEDDDGTGVPDASDRCPTTSASTPNGCPAPPATPRVNAPPVVRFRTPISGTAVRGSQTIELDVSDDAGPPTVSVFDDDGTICTVSAEPYACTWTPTGADVGRATLLASAVDSDHRSTLGIAPLPGPGDRAARPRAAHDDAEPAVRVLGRAPARPRPDSSPLRGQSDGGTGHLDSWAR